MSTETLTFQHHVMTMEADVQTIIDIELAEQALTLSRKRLRWDESKAMLVPIVRAVIKLGIEPSMRDADLNISFAGDSAKLKAVLDVLTDAEFITLSTPPKQGANDWCAYFKNQNCQVQIWLHFTSSVCIRRKIGTKMVEQDVYETVCGECTTESMQLPAPAPVLDTALLDDGLLF